MWLTNAVIIGSFSLGDGVEAVDVGVPVCDENSDVVDADAVPAARAE